MKSTGIVRKTDSLGRIVLPIEIRRNLGINEKDPVEIFIDEDKIILKKYVSSEENKAKKKHVKKLIKNCDDMKMRVGPAQKEHLEQIINQLAESIE